MTKTEKSITVVEYNIVRERRRRRARPAVFYAVERTDDE